ncbi:MAG TPA: hypothetical protein VHT05_09810 [Candidatus Elarobacter sp.]|jgi:hypothetical protein|nr:hypothetical protein [Candidatus Elarobacter sp.]
MARILESLEPGTPVYAGETRVGEVRGVFADGDSRSASLLMVKWDATGDEVAVPATEVQDVTERGVELMRREADQYADLAPFDADRFPTMKRIR